MGEYSPEYVKSLERAESNLDLDSDGNEGTPGCSEPEDDSSTDIDAIVEEYKEKLKVRFKTTALLLAQYIKPGSNPGPARVEIIGIECYVNAAPSNRKRLLINTNM